MLAFEEMRKRLEEQHAQQLSLLVAEQEREQEQLQKVSPRRAALGLPSGSGRGPATWLCLGHLQSPSCILI